MAGPSDPISSMSTPSSSFILVLLYIFLSIFRLMNAWMIRTQFDPDEYWQTLEPAYCLAFSSSHHNCAYTWEWTRRYAPNDSHATDSFSFLNPILYGPVRSYVSVLPTATLYHLARSLHLDSHYVVSKGPALLHAVLVAAPTDLAVYVIARRLFRHQKHATTPWWALFLSVTSWFHGYALVRTYSNSTECMLITVGVALVSPELFANTTFHKNTTDGINPSAILAFFLGGICLSIRFTGIAAWVPLGLILCLKKSTWTKTVYHLIVTCALPGLMGIACSSLVDWYFYGFWTVPFVGSFHFNVMLGQGSLYGVHPFYWYFLAGFPAITGAMLPFFLMSVIQIGRDLVSSIKHDDAKKEENTGVISLLFIITFYVCIHSISPHKEFRFILPILPLVCVTAGRALSEWIELSGNFASRLTDENDVRRHKRKIIGVVCFLFFLSNFPHLLFLSTMHQGAPLLVNKSIVGIILQEESSKRGTTGAVEDNGITSLPTDTKLSGESLNSPPQRENHASYTIHYLMGCHSTPVFSHLHHPSVTVQVHTLDCSPTCRADPSVTCESDDFLSDPISFVSSLYQHYLPGNQYHDDNLLLNDDSPDQVCNTDEHTSSQSTPLGGKIAGCIKAAATNIVALPHFVVLFEEDAKKVHSLLEEIGLKKINRFPHTINGYSHHNTTSSNISFLGKLLDNIQYDHMILYGREK